jgi:sugar lactone lactonase YvrE
MNPQTFTGSATSVNFNRPNGIAVDGSGNLYISISFQNIVCKVDPSGVISPFAGNGTVGQGGDGGTATSAQLNGPGGLAVDAAGNVYIADGSKIRIVNSSGIINTFAGTGIAGYSGNGGPAISAQINSGGIAIDHSGNVLILEGGNRIRKINTSGIITLFAGNGVSGYSGDGGQATLAQFNSPTGISSDAGGNIYVSDCYNYVIRRINPTGIVNTVAGNGTQGYSGDGGQAIYSQFHYPLGLANDISGNLYVADMYNRRVRIINASGIINSFAGNGVPSCSGDGGLSYSSSVSWPDAIAIDGSGNIYIASDTDGTCGVIRKVTFNSGIQQISDHFSQLDAYPNPVNENLNIEFLDMETEETEINIIDPFGKLVYKRILKSNKSMINVSEIENGIYLLRVIDKRQQFIFTKKIIVQH